MPCLRAACTELAIQGALQGTRIANAGKYTDDAAQENHMPTEPSAKDAHETMKDQVVEMYEDFEHEVELEAHSPHDSSQSDKLVRKHINGLVIAFFILIALALLAVVVVGRINTHH
jgi:hypothetical protein